MKKTVEILSVLIIFLFTACENEEIISVDVVHDEYTVVQAEIHPGEIFPAVRFTKTLPLGIPYTIEAAEIKNVTAYIRKNGEQIIPLHYITDGLYKPLYEFYVQEGEMYELFADREGTYIYSITKIPHTPVITNTAYNTNEFYLNANVVQSDDQVYAALWRVSAAPPITADDFFSVASGIPLANLLVRTSPLPEQYRTNTYVNTRYILVYAFDKSFKEYFNTRTAGNDINDPFVQGGSEIIWNVQGDKVIGLFIGVTPALPRLVF
jgi:hypothetical protein